MIHIKRGTLKRSSHKKILKYATGYKNDSSRKYKIASLKITKALQHSYKETYLKKRKFKKNITKKINNQLKLFNINYSKIISSIKNKNIKLNNNILYTILINEPSTFYSLLTGLAH